MSLASVRRVPHTNSEATQSLATTRLSVVKTRCTLSTTASTRLSVILSVKSGSQGNT